jgi:hypothetical protein
MATLQPGHVPGYFVSSLMGNHTFSIEKHNPSTLESEQRIVVLPDTLDCPDHIDDFLLFLHSHCTPFSDGSYLLFSQENNRIQLQLHPASSGDPVDNSWELTVWFGPTPSSSSSSIHRLQDCDPLSTPALTRRRCTVEEDRPPPSMTTTTLGWMLGFRNTEYHFRPSTFARAESHASLCHPCSVLYLVLDDRTKNRKHESHLVPLEHSSIHHDIAAKVIFDTPSSTCSSLCVVNIQNQRLLTAKREFMDKVDIYQVAISFLDVHGRNCNAWLLDGIHHVSCSFALETV